MAKGEDGISEVKHLASMGLQSLRNVNLLDLDEKQGKELGDQEHIWKGLQGLLLDALDMENEETLVVLMAHKIRKNNSAWGLGW